MLSLLLIYLATGLCIFALARTRKHVAATVVTGGGGADGGELYSWYAHARSVQWKLAYRNFSFLFLEFLLHAFYFKHNWFWF